MKVFTHIEKDLLEASSCALGMFDGVHLGHQQVLQGSVQYARKYHVEATTITFSNHPQTITTKTPAKQLTSLENRLQLFEKCGIQTALVIQFDEAFSKVQAEDFIKDVLVQALHVQHISIGYDYRFGNNKKGDKNLLNELGHVYNYTVTTHEPYHHDGQIVSSSVIRKLIYDGNMELANNLLGYAYHIKDLVMQGAGRGKNLGFPTANLIKNSYTVYPARGVYFGYVTYNNVIYKALINIGKRPTFQDILEELLEVHILDFQGDLYGQEIDVTFIQKIREEQQFASSEALVRQIQQDCLMAKALPV